MYFHVVNLLMTKMKTCWWSWSCFCHHSWGCLTPLL
jgi:hypothetical protein